MRLSLLALLPAIAALQLPHIPTPQDALHAADSFLSSTVHSAAASLSAASDMNLAIVSQDEHTLITSARHPVGTKIIFPYFTDTTPNVRSTG